MSRKLGFCGLIMMATFSIYALGPHAAQAAIPGTLTAESYPATLSGTQLNTHRLELTDLVCQRNAKFPNSPARWLLRAPQS